MATKKGAPTKTILGLEVSADLDERLLKWGGILGGEIALMIALSVIIVVPQIARIQAANRDLQDEQQNLAELQEKADLLANFTVNFADREQTLTSIFTQKRDIGAVVSSLRQVASLAGIELSTYTVRTADMEQSAVSTGPRVPALTIDLTINGSAQNTTAFITAIDRSLPLKTLENFQVVRNLLATGSAVLTSDQLIQTRLEINSYYLPIDVRIDPSRPLQPFGEKQLRILEELTGYTRPQIAQPTLDTGIAVPNTDLFAQ